MKLGGVTSAESLEARKLPPVREQKKFLVGTLHLQLQLCSYVGRALFSFCLGHFSFSCGFILRLFFTSFLPFGDFCFLRGSELERENGFSCSLLHSSVIRRFGTSSIRKEGKKKDVRIVAVIFYHSPWG